MMLRYGMRKDLYKTYMESEILNADPMKLVCLLYRGAIERVREARRSLKEGDIAGRSAAISRATSIINELMLSVDRDRGGEIARNLVEMYDYLVRCLNEGNFRQTDHPLAEAERLLTVLADAWEECRLAVANGEHAELYEPVSCAG